jgi:hypothetical protein
MKTAFTLLALATLALAQVDIAPRWYTSKETPPVTTYVTTYVCLKIGGLSSVGF